MAKNGGSTNAGSQSGGEVFDVRRIRRFVELMNEHELTEVDLRQGEQRIRLRRGPEVVTVDGAAGALPPQAAAPSAVPAAPASDSTAAAPADDPNMVYVTSPMVGSFYSAANPESPAFVKVGDQVGPETTVCIVEAMKVFNEIPAGCSGKIVAMLVENGDAVEFGQKLFQVQKAG